MIVQDLPIESLWGILEQDPEICEHVSPTRIELWNEEVFDLRDAWICLDCGYYYLEE